MPSRKNPRKRSKWVQTNVPRLVEMWISITTAEEYLFISIIHINLFFLCHHWTLYNYKLRFFIRVWCRVGLEEIMVSLEIVDNLNPSNAKATFIQSTRMQRFLKTIETLSCWYSLESSHWVLSDEYPFARVSVIFQFFLHHFVLAKLATSSIRVNAFMLRAEKFLEISGHLKNPC